MSLPLLWFLLGFVFLAVELAAPTMVLCFFGIGAWVTACVALTGLAAGWQVALFIVASFVALRLLRQRFRHVFGGRAETARNALASGGGDEMPPPHPLTGRTGVVSKGIRPEERGEVRIDGSFWRATAREPIPEGREVRVLGGSREDSLLLRVIPLVEDEGGCGPERPPHP